MLNKKKAKVILLDEYITQSISQLKDNIVRLDTKSYEDMIKTLNATKTTINNLEEEKVALGIKIGRKKLLDGKHADKLTIQKEEIHKKLDTYYLDAFRTTLKLCMLELALDKDKAFYKSLKTSNSYIKLIGSKSLDGADDYYQIVRQFGRAHFGIASMAMSSSQCHHQKRVYLIHCLTSGIFCLNHYLSLMKKLFQVLIFYIYLPFLYLDSLLQPFIDVVF